MFHGGYGEKPNVEKIKSELYPQGIEIYKNSKD
jgi:hypothetical protein